MSNSTFFSILNYIKFILIFRKDILAQKKRKKLKKFYENYFTKENNSTHKNKMDKKEETKSNEIAQVQKPNPMLIKVLKPKSPVPKFSSSLISTK